MRLHFYKYHGAGNDYIYLDCRADGLPPRAAQWARVLARRHFGVGADGLICLCPPLLADGDAAMRMFNADGSEGEMCGNGVRGAAEFLFTHGAPREVLRIDTLRAGRRTLRRAGAGVWQAEMGRFTARAAQVPAVGLGRDLTRACLSALGQTWDAACLSVGNPHCVVPWPADEPLPTGERLAALGAALGAHPAFPHGANVEFAALRGVRRLAVTVWERGSGATLACGTGACACAAAFVLRGACPRGAAITVEMPGGALQVSVLPDDTLLLTGPAVFVFEGDAEVDG